MKKQLLVLTAMVMLAGAANAQNLLRAIKGNNGIAKQYAAFSGGEQKAFTPQTARSVLGLDAKSGLVLKNTEKDDLGFTHYRFYQTYNGLPIESSMLVAHVKNGKLVSVSASLVTDFDAAMQSRSNIKIIPAKDAVAAAIKSANAIEYAWQNKDMEAALKAQLHDKNASYYPKAEKVWYNAGDVIDVSQLRVAYKIDVYTQQPNISRAYYYIDAQTGVLLGKENRMHTTDVTGTANTLYSGTQTIHSDKTGTNTYRLRDYSRGNGVITLQSNGAEYTNSSANWNLALPNQNAMDAHWGVEMTYDFYKINFNRNSIDNNGYALVSYVNKGGFLYSNNASWDGNSMNYGKRSGAVSPNGVTGIDVTGHELTHGVTQNTSGLNYKGESGAINESMSDCMGKSVQFFTKPADKNWKLSNDMNWFIRDMANPNAYQQPDTYKGKSWASTVNLSIFNDNGGVHTNSGVGNYMFYLLTDGGSGVNDIGNAFNVSGIGLAKADQVLYRSETTYLTPTSQYIDWRNACINAATDLFGASSNEVAQVKNAWYAVGVGTASLNAEKAQPFITNISINPNPVGNTVSTLHFNLQKEGNIMVKIFDGSAHLSQTYSLGFKAKGKQSFTLSKLAALQAGSYYAVLQEEGFTSGHVSFTVVK